jgi:translation initiation factor 3 subunit G
LSPSEIHFAPITNIKTITTSHISPTTTHRIRTIKKICVSESHAQQERIQLHLTFRNFGAEEGKPPGVDENTTSFGDDVPFYIGPNWREKEQKEQLELRSVICRICGGKHYTMHCIYSSVVDQIPENKQVDPVKNKYVPPNRRGNGTALTTDVGKKASTNCLIVSNLSQQITEDEFFARFARFGKIIKVSLPRHHTTRECKGYGFVTFLKRENAERALELMDRRGYDNLIMRVAWDKQSITRLAQVKSDK